MLISCTYIYIYMLLLMRTIGGVGERERETDRDVDLLLSRPTGRPSSKFLTHFCGLDGAPNCAVQHSTIYIYIYILDGHLNKLP